MRWTADENPSFWCIICPRSPVGTLRFTKIDVFPIFSEMTENAHFCSKFKSNTNFKLRRTSQILFWHSQRSSKALNFENLCVNTLFLIEKSDFLAHFHLLKCSFLLQIQVQDHFWTQQSIPNSILELSDLSWTFKVRKFGHKHPYFGPKKRYFRPFWVTFPRSAHSHFTTKPPRDLLDVLKWTLGSP